MVWRQARRRSPHKRYEQRSPLWVINFIRLQISNTVVVQSMVRDSLNSNRFSLRRRPLTARRPPPGTSRRGRPLPIGPENPMPNAPDDPHECVTDETTWRLREEEMEYGVCGLLRLEDGCCVLQHGRDVQLLEMYKHFLQHPHVPMNGEFEDWVRNLDGLESVSKATVSMSNPDFLLIPALVSKLQSCGTSIDVRVDHTVGGDVMPFKFTNLFLGETRYIGEVARSDPSQSVARTVMDVQNFVPEIHRSAYPDPHHIDFYDENPALVVSLINITPVLRNASPRHLFFHTLTILAVNMIGSVGPSGHSISPSSFKFELGKDFLTYFEHIPDGYQRLLPESIGEATQVASELKDYADNSVESEHFRRNFITSTQLETSADPVAVAVVYDFEYTMLGQRCAYLVKITLWPLVCVETQNINITGQYVASDPSVAGSVSAFRMNSI